MKNRRTRARLGVFATALIMLAQTSSLSAEDSYAEVLEAYAPAEFKKKDMAVPIARASAKRVYTISLLGTLDIHKDCPVAVAGLFDEAFSDTAKELQVVYKSYRSRLDELFRKTLSENEAKGAAEFFGSDDGREFMAWVRGMIWVQSIQVDPISAALDDRDNRSSSEASGADDNTSEILGENSPYFDLLTLPELSSEQLYKFGQALSESSWGPKLNGLRPKIQAIASEMFDKDGATEFEGMTEEFAEICAKEKG